MYNSGGTSDANPKESFLLCLGRHVSRTDGWPAARFDPLSLAPPDVFVISDLSTSLVSGFCSKGVWWLVSGEMPGPPIAQACINKKIARKLQHSSGHWTNWCNCLFIYWVPTSWIFPRECRKWRWVQSNRNYLNY